MTFASFGWGALAAIAGATALTVLGLYLLRRTPKPQLVSNVTFWMRAAQSSRPRFLRASRIPWLAFLVTLLIAMLFVTEIGDPRFGRGVRGTTVIVLAAGRSMGGTFAGERRIDRATREVRRWVDRTTAGGRVAVVRAGMRPETLLALTDDPADLERALAGFELDDGPADLDGALELADRIVTASGDPGQILLVADRDVEHETQATRVLIPVGVPSDTLAITDFTARRDPLAAGEYVAQVQLRSFSSREGSARLRIMDGEVPLLDRRVTLPAGDGARLTAQGFSAERAELEARLEDIEIAGSEDALAVDDVAPAVVPPLEPLSILFVTPGNVFLRAALAVHPNANVEQIAPGDFASRDAEALAAHDVLVLDRTPLPEGVDHPSVVLFSPTDGQLAASGPAESPRVTAMLGSHPALRGVRLDGIRIGRSLRFATDPGDQVLIRSGADALAVAREVPGRRLVAYGLDLSSTDLVEREAFPLMVHDSLHWAAAARDELPLPRRLGEPLYAADQTVLGPDGEPVSATERAAIRQQGIYHVGERALAFSGTVHARELPSGATAGRFRTSDPLPPLAVLVAAALLGLMLLEWTLLHRGRLE
ncbi:MAG TPA: BatA and WFA domain-containing protein [Sandaracinaceae bacterium LLY-WYZ-13_1]|nr:BatA and WFA domain-containing protein [Sandaracinaceae bacterium LLY-WYZ-13_1]